MPADLVAEVQARLTLPLAANGGSLDLDSTIRIVAAEVMGWMLQDAHRETAEHQMPARVYAVGDMVRIRVTQGITYRDPDLEDEGEDATVRFTVPAGAVCRVSTVREYTTPFPYVLYHQPQDRFFGAAEHDLERMPPGTTAEGPAPVCTCGPTAPGMIHRLGCSADQKLRADARLDYNIAVLAELAKSSDPKVREAAERAKNDAHSGRTSSREAAEYVQQLVDEVLELRWKDPEALTEQLVEAGTAALAAERAACTCGQGNASGGEPHADACPALDLLN